MKNDGDVVVSFSSNAEHSKHIFCGHLSGGSQFVQRFIDERLHSVQAATLAEIEIDLLLRYRLQQICLLYTSRCV